MNRTVIAIIMLIVCGVFCSGYSQELSPVIKVYQLNAPDKHLEAWNWITPLEYKKISDWAKIYKCIVNVDDPPVVDSTAWFMGKYGSILVFENLTEVKYFLHINFVTYDNPSNTLVDAMCTILFNNMLVKRLVFNDMTVHNSRIVLEVSREHIVNRVLTVEFKEYSSAGGFFGIWDVVLSRDDTLPDLIDINKTDTPKPSMKKAPHVLVKPKN